MMNMYIVFGFIVLFGFWSGVSANSIQRVFANRGSTVILPCRRPIYHADKYKMTWSRDGGANTITTDQQTPGSQYSIDHNDFIWNLKITNLQLNNGGEYICLANSTISITEIFKLQIQEIKLDTKRVLEVKERESVYIECPVSVTQKPTVGWYKDDKPISYFNVGPNNMFRLYYASKKNSGEYRCDVSSGQNTYTGQFTLHVEGTPPTNITAVQGSTVILPCKFTGVNFNRFKVHWYQGKGDNRYMLSKGNTVFTPSPRYSIMKDGDQTWNLQIDDLQPYDGGEFMCEVYAGPPARQIVNLRVQELKNRVIIKTALESSTIVLPCSYDINVDSPHTKVRWFDNNIILVSNNQTTFTPRYEILHPTRHDWNLKLSNVQSSDAGNFSCKLITKGGTWNNTVVLKVGDPPKYDNILPEETIVTEGESLSLTCNSSGSPQPSVTWYKYSDQFEKHVVSEGQRLTLPHVTRYDAGNFECIAENSIPPTARMKTGIKVEFAPEIQFLEGRLEVERGSETILKCDVTSYPQSAVMWIREGEKLFNSWKYRIDVTETGYTKHVTLTLNTTEEDDFGSYVCEARNKIDKTQKALKLFEADIKKITTKPTTNFKLGNTNIRVVTAKKGSTVTLPCQLKAEEADNLQVCWFETLAWKPLSIGDLSLTIDPRYRVYRPFPSQWNLIIEDVREDDEKSYSCLINTEPILNETFYLKVE